MKQLKSILHFLFYPSAFKIGLITTLLFVYLSANFYTVKSLSAEERNAALERNFILSFLFSIHQRSLDWRMVARGERPGTPEIVLVTVDEHAVEKLGRWPWSRKIVAGIIDTLMGSGAKLLGFDAIFSEPEVNAALSTLHKIREKGPLSKDLQDLVDSEIAQANTDQILANMVEKYSDKLVMGSYFDQAPNYSFPIQELCDDMVTQNTSQFKFLEKEEQAPIVLDPFTAELPDKLKEGLSAIFQTLESDIRAKHPATSPEEQRDQDAKIEEAKRRYCFDFLTPRDAYIEGHRQIWPQIQTSAEDLKNLSFEDGISFLKYNKYLYDEVSMTGRWWLNVPSIAAVTKHTGYFNAFQDSDGSIRNTDLLVRYGGRYFPSLALRLAMLYKKNGLLVTMAQDPTNPSSKIIKDLNFTDLESGEASEKIPVDGAGQLAINYAGAQNMFGHMSAAELFNGKDVVKVRYRRHGILRDEEYKKSDFIKNKVFLFGATAIGIYDLRVTPFQENFPGLETHANVLDNILRQDYLLPSPLEPQYMAYTLLILGIILSFFLKYLGAVSGLLTTLVTLTALYVVDRFYFFKHGIVVAILLPIVMVFLIYVLLTFYKYLTEERKKRALKGTFQKYVSPSIVNEILKDPSNLELGGKKQHMSVMFSDVRGFTTISEKLDPQALTKILNTYLTPMTHLVFNNKGTLDKYMGDAIMAFFGAPIAYPDHAKMACRCALQMMEKLKVLQAEFKANNLPEIDIGIGINTGDMNVGNMGSDIVRSYTVMGDAVNLGSRLEGINKQYGTHIIISEFTQKEVANDFVTREIDWVRVKGKLLPVRIFELVSEKSAPESTLNLLKRFQEGFEFYHQKSWQNAIESFQRAIEINPADGPSLLYLERCQEYVTAPPPDNWDGVFEMKTK